MVENFVGDFVEIYLFTDREGNPVTYSHRRAVSGNGSAHSMINDPGAASRQAELNPQVTVKNEAEELPL